MSLSSSTTPTDRLARIVRDPLLWGWTKDAWSTLAGTDALGEKQ